MRKLMWLLPAVALWLALPAAGAQPARPPGPRIDPPRPGIPGLGDPFGRRPGIPGLPGLDVGPVIPRQGLPDLRFPPPGGFGPGGPAVNPAQDDKDRDKHNGLSAIRHIPRILHGAGPEFREAFRATPASELALGAGRSGGKAGRGLMAGIGAAIAGLFRALFGRKKDEGST